MPGQAQRQHADEEGGQRPAAAAASTAAARQGGILDHDQRIDVGADPEERRMTEGQQAGHAEHQVVAEREDAPDQDQRGEVEPALVLQHGRQGGEQQHHEQRALHACRPLRLKSPSGRTIRVRISSA